MNKIYRVVWSKVKNCYVVVSELAKNVISRSVKSAKIGSSPVAKGLALGAMMAFVITGNVMAADSSLNIVTSQLENQKGSFAIGEGASIDAKYTGGDSASNLGCIAIGKNAKAFAFNNADNASSIAIGAEAFANGRQSVALGGEASALELATAIGCQTEADGKSIAIGALAVASDGIGGTATYSVAIGASAKASGESSVAIGNSSMATEDYVVSVGSDAATGGDSIKRRIVNVADGVKENDAVTVGQMNKAIGDVTNAYEVADTALKTEVDAVLALKANAADVYTKNEVDNTFATQTELSKKADKDNVYTKTETDGLLDAKANVVDVYTKTEVDGLINGGSAAIAGINQRLDRTNAKINKVGAGAAALAALHPLDYDPDDKLTFSAGVGNYAGENAAALGAFYRPNEKFMVSLGGTMGNGENMVNLGISVGLDKANGYAKMSKRELIQEVNSVKAENEAMKDQLANADERIAKLESLVAQLVNK